MTRTTAPQYATIRAQYVKNAAELLADGQIAAAARYRDLSHADNQTLARHVSADRVRKLVAARLEQMQRSTR